MKSSHVAVAGGVFVAVLVVCFAAIGFGSKNEAASKPDAVPLAPDLPAAEPKRPAPKPAPAAPAERGYDGTAALARLTPSAAAVIATWTLPAADVREFGDTYRDVRLSGERFVAVSDTGIRVLNARTGEPAGDGVTAAKDFPDTALSPNGDWAVQPTAAGVTRIDTATGKTTKLPATAARSFAGPAGFGSDNGWCAVLGEENGQPALFRVRKGGGAVERIGPYRPNSDRGDASRIGRLHASAEGGRVVVERPAERSPTPRLLSWAPPGPALAPLPAFNAAVHDGVTRFHLSPDGKRAVMFDAATLKVFDLDDGRLLLTHAPGNLKIGGAAFAPNGGRLVIAYATERVDGDVENTGLENVFLPGHAWVLDLAAKDAVGKKLTFADLGIGKGFRRCVLSSDGARLAVVETTGRVHLVDTDRAFGANVLTGAPAAAPAGDAPPVKPIRRVSDS